MLKYLNVKPNDAVDSTMQPHVRGTPPYLILGRVLERVWGSQLVASGWNGAGRIAYHDSASPIEFEMWIKKGIADFIESNPNDDFIFAYSDQSLLYKDYSVLQRMYQDRLAQQVDQIVRTLQWSKVKNERQDDFFKGLRLLKTAPSVALQICLSCYNFEEWEINWGDPRTYYNGIKEIIGLAGAFI